MNLKELTMIKPYYVDISSGEVLPEPEHNTILIDPNKDIVTYNNSVSFENRITSIDYDVLGKYCTNGIKTEDYFFNRLISPDDVYRVASESCYRFGEDLYVNTDLYTVTRFFALEDYISLTYGNYAIIRLDIFNKLGIEELTIEEFKVLVGEFLHALTRRKYNKVLGYCYSLELGEHKDKRKRENFRYRFVDEERWHCHLHLFLDCRDVIHLDFNGKKEWLASITSLYEEEIYEQYTKIFKVLGRWRIYVQKKWLKYPCRPVIDSRYILQRNTARHWLGYICKETRRMVEYRQNVKYAKLHQSSHF